SGAVLAPLRQIAAVPGACPLSPGPFPPISGERGDLPDGALLPLSPDFGGKGAGGIGGERAAPSGDDAVVLRCPDAESTMARMARSSGDRAWPRRFQRAARSGRR